MPVSSSREGVGASLFELGAVVVIMDRSLPILPVRRHPRLSRRGLVRDVAMSRESRHARKGGRGA